MSVLCRCFVVVYMVSIVGFMRKSLGSSVAVVLDWGFGWGSPCGVSSGCELSVAGGGDLDIGVSDFGFIGSVVRRLRSGNGQDLLRFVGRLVSGWDSQSQSVAAELYRPPW